MNRGRDEKVPAFHITAKHYDFGQNPFQSLCDRYNILKKPCIHQLSGSGPDISNASGDISMRFGSERLIYREFTENEFHLFYSVFSNESIMKYALMDRYECKDDALPYFQKVLKNNLMTENRKAFEFAVSFTSNGDFIGFADIEIHDLNCCGGSGEIGYFILPDFWGHGYATETANALIELCFMHLNLHRVTARCNANNIQSESVMKKAGMQKEGEFRKARFKNGRWENEQHYSILIEEWQEGNRIIQPPVSILNIIRTDS
jgi:[ribosomal protein S5]-alanine N-acetyltransferase